MVGSFCSFLKLKQASFAILPSGAQNPFFDINEHNHPSITQVLHKCNPAQMRTKLLHTDTNMLANLTHTQTKSLSNQLRACLSKRLFRNRESCRFENQCTRDTLSENIKQQTVEGAFVHLCLLRPDICRDIKNHRFQMILLAHADKTWQASLENTQNEML